MLELKGKDLFLLSKIIEKMDIKTKIPLMKYSEDKEEQEAINKKFGIELVVVLVESIYKAEQDIYKLLSNVTKKDIKQIEEMSFKELKDLVTELFSSEEFTSFFK
jgi:hypothetical protein